MVSMYLHDAVAEIEDEDHDSGKEDRMSERLIRLKEKMEQEKYTCIIGNGTKEYSSRERGVKPLLGWIEENVDVRGYAAADQVVGRAAALLYARLGVTEVYSRVISEPARKALQDNGIECSFGESVPYIINRRGDGMCPMEQTVLEINDPDEAVTALKEKLRSMRQQ